MLRSSDAVVVEITRWPFGTATGLPSIDRTMCGVRRIPPLAIASYTVAIWIGVTDSPWPNGSVYIDVPEYCDGARIVPACSPGSWTPVRLPRPNRCTHALKRSAPSRWPIRAAPMLLDWARIPAVVSVSLPWGSASRIVDVYGCSADGISNGVLGLIKPSCRAPATVIGLNVEPGS